MYNTPENRRFGCGSAHVRNFDNVSGQQSPLLTHLWVCHRGCGDPLYITGIMVHFRYYVEYLKNGMLLGQSY